MKIRPCEKWSEDNSLKFLYSPGLRFLFSICHKYFLWIHYVQQKSTHINKSSWTSPVKHYSILKPPQHFKLMGILSVLTQRKARNCGSWRRIKRRLLTKIATLVHGKHVELGWWSRLLSSRSMAMHGISFYWITSNCWRRSLLKTCKNLGKILCTCKT